MKSTEPIESGVLPPCVGSIPPVSTILNLRPFHSASPNRRSRVVPAVSSTIAKRSPAKRLKSVDLPTFGRPTKATMGFMIFYIFQLPAYGLGVGDAGSALIGGITTSILFGLIDWTTQPAIRISTFNV